MKPEMYLYTEDIHKGKKMKLIVWGTRFDNVRVPLYELDIEVPGKVWNLMIELEEVSNET